MCLVATGTTFTLETTGAVGRIVSIDGFSEEITDIPDDDLATIGHNEYCPGGKIEHTPLAMTIVFDPNDVKGLGTVELGTLTFPAQTGYDTGATLTGTGYLRQRGFNTLENNVRIEGSYEFRFDGKATVPTYTPGTPTP